jgi:hypothetical protein
MNLLGILWPVSINKRIVSDKLKRVVLWGMIKNALPRKRLGGTLNFYSRFTR